MQKVLQGFQHPDQSPTWTVEDHLTSVQQVRKYVSGPIANGPCVQLLSDIFRCLTQAGGEGLNLAGENDGNDEPVDGHRLAEDHRDQVLRLNPAGVAG